MDLANIRVQYGNPFHYSGLKQLEWELTKADVRLR